MRIGDAAAAAGTTPRALRLYEQRGLLPPPVRTASGQRVYGPAEVARVGLIRRLLALGLTIEDLRSRAHRLDLLTEDPPTACAASGGGPETFTPVVEHRLAVLDTEIARLTRLRDDLARHTATDEDPCTATDEDPCTGGGGSHVPPPVEIRPAAGTIRSDRRA
ncbi:MerR family transcriptional regulator [Kitasatospora sp. NBC_01539]|uniref:MerR family transcriptional regulator n=1 Tax=Kitasatospora sp. NBC_01539 TaxID=2903577 RepID=UPI0038601E7B